MSCELWVAGFPSYYGGADTELDHNIDLFRRFGVEVNLVPMFGAETSMRASVIERGCTIHEYRDDIFAGKVVISFCNGRFLEKLPLIIEHGRPAAVIWFNCMTWLFEREKEAHRQGWIDIFGFESEYQKRLLLPQLEQIRPVSTFAYRPYFNAARIQWNYREWDGCYKVGRISRDDAHKFAPDTWRIFDRVLVPKDLKKKVYILGYGKNAKTRIGEAPPTLDWQTWSPNSIPAAQFYNTIDTMIHKTGGSRESSSRVLFEAYAYGVVPVVERDFAFPEVVIHGQTGFMGSSSDEMSYYASMLAMNPAVHRSVALNGRHYLEERLSNADECWAGWHTMLADHGKHSHVRQNHGEITPDSLQPLPPGKIFDPAPRIEAEPAG
jgi:glycosyltransferase involved in cell wall biosynthesis